MSVAVIAMRTALNLQTAGGWHVRVFGPDLSAHADTEHGDHQGEQHQSPVGHGL